MKEPKAQLCVDAIAADVAYMLAKDSGIGITEALQRCKPKSPTPICGKATIVNATFFRQKQTVIYDFHLDILETFRLRQI